MISIAAVLETLFLLAVANASPILLKRVLGTRLAFPLDAGVTFIDGRPLFGASKTVRGIVVAAATTALAAPLVGHAWTVGLAVGLSSMAGDLISSFIKRRLGLAPSSRATGLDQVPEALIPALVCAGPLGLTPADITAVVLFFVVGGIVLSRLAYEVGLRERPH